MKPDPIHWIIAASHRRNRDMKWLEPCESSNCMLLPCNTGNRHADDCHCHNRKHAMIELAKINSRFAREVEEAVRADHREEEQ